MDFIRIKDGDQRLFTLTWTLASGVGKGLTVYSIQDGKLQELLDTTCTDYTIADLDQDGTEELFTLSYEGCGTQDCTGVFVCRQADEPAVAGICVARTSRPSPICRQDS